MVLRNYSFNKTTGNSDDWINSVDVAQCLWNYSSCLNQLEAP